MLKKLFNSASAALYKAEEFSNQSLRAYVFSAPESRAICNDPLVLGIDYTNKLRIACTKALGIFSELDLTTFRESEAVVLNILRGGLNFGLREAIADALHFNQHASVFISAQRQQLDDHSWIITEDTYKKIDLQPVNHILFGDVVATGTSLYHALDVVFSYATANKKVISELTFFTIGGPKTIDIFQSLFDKHQSALGIKRINIIFLEGIFAVADQQTPYRIKIDGTDLIRLGGLQSPEFISSQRENPLYPLERCTIYDAGSRAYNVQEYLHDVIDYWQKVKALATEISAHEYLMERVGREDFNGNLDLEELANQHLQNLSRLAVC